MATEKEITPPEDDEEQTGPTHPAWAEALAADTPAEEIHQRAAPGGSGKMLSYVTARFVQDRLDTAVGPTNWQNMFETLPNGAVRCGISIRNLDFVSGSDGEWITKWDVGTPSSIEPDKGAHSDAFKRAGVLWGIARDLYEERDEDQPAPQQARQRSSGGTVRSQVAQPVQQQYAEDGEDDRNEPPWVCPIHDDAKEIPAGISKRTGRAYSAFWACPVAGCDEKEPRRR